MMRGSPNASTVHNIAARHNKGGLQRTEGSTMGEGEEIKCIKKCVLDEPCLARKELNRARTSKRLGCAYVRW